MSIITVAQATDYASAAGFTGDALTTIVAIAQAESGLDTTAVNVNSDSHTFTDGHVGPSTDNGLVQINDYWHPEVTLAQADDPAQAMLAAYTISHSGTDFTPWSTYNSGAYLRFMPASTLTQTQTGGTPVTTVAGSVHIEIPHFANHALWEGAVAWDACGCVANEVALAALGGRTPDPGNAQQVRARDLASGHFTTGSGQTLADIVWDINQRGFHQLDVIPYSGSPDLNALHDLVKSGGLNGWPVIIQVSRAYNLPDNEAGVNYHFVVSGGIDSTLGYLIANGDTRTGIARQPGFPANTQLPTNWATWATLVNAGICGAILVKPMGWTPPTPAPAPAPVPAPQPTPAPVPAPAPADDDSALAAQVAAAQALAQQALTAAQAAQAAVDTLRTELKAV